MLPCTTPYTAANFIWDNTGTMHRALPYPMDSGRLMYRTQIAGEEPIT
ncbi:MAG: hypothetical protein R3228_11125 [Halioglobus sp.]|nr:hypothetical protein [Halioglobus sp.]